MSTILTALTTTSARKRIILTAFSMSENAKTPTVFGFFRGLFSLRSHSHEMPHLFSFSLTPLKGVRMRRGMRTGRTVEVYQEIRPP
jgi:hypothetical protein